MTESDPVTNCDSADNNDKFLQLFTENQGNIYVYILGLCPSRFDADDIMQDTVSVMWRKFNDYQAGTDFIAWAITIAKFTILSFRKKQKKGHIHFDEDVLNYLNDKSKRLITDIDSRVDALEGCVKKLPDDHAKLLKLRYVEELSVKKIAARFDRPNRVIYKHLSKIHLMLMECVQRSLAREAL